MTDPSTTVVPGQQPGILARVFRVLRPSHEHSALSATLLLMTAVMLSRILGLVREAYIGWAFGAGSKTDAYVAAFTLPETVNYLLAGGAASITFVAMLTRYAAEGREKEGEKAFSVIVTVISAVLLALTGIAWFVTPFFTRWWFPNFAPDEMALCIHLTRIILPVQGLFVVGGVISAMLQWRRQFLYPALQPILYNLGIIAGGVLLSRWLGVASLAWGALGGAFFGAFFINVIGARHIGVRYRPSFQISHPGFREWLRLSVPLMLGFSLVFFDDVFMRHFSDKVTGAITRINYAKRLFSVPMAVVGQAVGQASLPFFANLFGQKKLREFDETVNGAVYRASSFSILASAFLMAASLPIVDIVFRLVRGGSKFQYTDSVHTAQLLFWFSVALVFWCAQGLYARAYYAAGDTLTPMIAGSIITVALYPVYWALFRGFGIVGLAIASDVGIAIHTLTLATLLHRKRLVRFGTLKWVEFGKAAGTAVFAVLTAHYVGAVIPLTGSRKNDFAALALVAVTWLGAVAVGLWITKSELPRALRRRRS